MLAQNGDKKTKQLTNCNVLNVILGNKSNVKEKNYT